LNQEDQPSIPHKDPPHPEFDRDTPQPYDATQTRIPIKLPLIRPVFTYSLLVTTVAVFLLQLGTQYLLQIDIPAYYGLKVNQLIAGGQLWRLITPMFLHGSFLHVAFNMYALSKIGPRLERFYGHWRFLALYLLSGFGGNVFSMLFTEAPSLGSSTAIFGLIGAQGVFFYHNRKIFGPSFRQALNNIITIAMVNLIIGLSPGIDNWGHIGGLIGGVIFAWVGGPVMVVTGIFPDMALSDQRRSTEILQAIGLVAGFFSLLTAGALYLMR